MPGILLKPNMVLSNKCCICNKEGKTYFKIDCDGPIIGKFTIKKCPSCKLLYLEPCLKDKFLKLLYADDYFNMNYIPFEKEKILYFNQLLNRIKKHLGRRILDFGCGIGIFLVVAKKYGFDTKGIEISDYAIKSGRKRYGIDIFHLSKIDTLKKEQFDTITMFDNLEHLNDPAGTIQKLRNLLKSTGRLIIKVPDIKSPAHQINILYGKIKHTNSMHVPTHVNHFSKKTLQLFLKKNGFKTILITNITDPFMMFPVATNWKHKLFNTFMRIYQKINWGDSLLCIAEKE